MLPSANYLLLSRSLAEHKEVTLFNSKAVPVPFIRGPQRFQWKDFMELAGPRTCDLSPQTSSRQGNILHTLSIINNRSAWTWIESICYDFVSMARQKINFRELTVGRVRISSSTHRHDNHRIKSAVSLMVVSRQAMCCKCSRPFSGFMFCTIRSTRMPLHKYLTRKVKQG